MRKPLLHHLHDSIVPHERNDFRPYLLRSIGMVVALFVFSSFALGTILYRSALTGSDFLASVLPSVLVDLANADRQSSALPALSVNPLLVKAAQLKADDMAAKSYFSHVSPDGSSPWFWFNKAGYSFVYAGENLAINFDDSVAVNDAWMNSPLHRANILGSHYSEVGLATAEGIYQGKSTTFVVEEFGSPAVAPAPLAVATFNTFGSQPTPAEVTPPAPVESSIVPITVAEAAPTTEPTVSGASSFIAVKDVSATPLTSEATVTEKPVPASTLSERVFSSPSMLLEIFYGLAGLLLVIGILVVSLVPHPGQKRHLVRLVLLSTAIIALYLVAGYFTFSNLVIQ